MRLRFGAGEKDELSRDEARRALADGVKACGLCRSGVDLGILVCRGGRRQRRPYP